MSEHISIQEGGKSRNFGPVNLLETETADGEGSCFWVPESERELETEFIINNGDYTSKKYAFSELDVHVMEPIGDFEITIDDMDLPHIDIGDIDLSIDPITGLPDLKIDGVDIDLPDISADIDLDADIDISVDMDGLDISGIDMDGLDANLNIDLDTLDIDTTDLPDEIRIMHVPTKTAYKDGEEIDLDGLVVQAYRGGEVWEDKDGKYVNGYIPVHELRYDPTIAKNSNPNNWLIDYGENPDNIPPVLYSANPISLIEYVERNEVKNKIVGEPEAYEIWTEIEILGYGTHVATKWTVARLDGLRYYLLTDANATRYRQRYKQRYKYQSSPWGEWGNWSDWNVQYRGGRSVVFNGKREACAEPLPLGLNTDDYDLGGWKRTTKFLTPVTIGFESYDDDYGKIEWALIRGEDDGKNIHANIEHISVSWPRPHDNKLLTASFDIFVENSEGGVDSGGTHHSGTWGDDNTGHFGGTTISGDFGGSHHSGKF